MLFTGWSNLLTMLSYNISYITFFKTLAPYMVELIVGDKDDIPSFLGYGVWEGQVFWAGIYCFVIMTPMSLPRTVGVLRYNSLFGILWSFYMIAVVVCIFFFDRTMVPNMAESFKKVKYIEISYEGMINAFPFVKFWFLYQQSLPIIYREMKRDKYKRTNKALILATAFVLIAYIVYGIFGYMDIIINEEAIEIMIRKQNLIEAKIPNWAFKIAVIAILFFVVFPAGAFWILPAKDTYEEIVYGDK